MKSVSGTLFFKPMGGADALQVKELARHTDVRTTQRYYHGSTSRLRSIVNNRGKVVPLKERKVK
jgi:integrase